MTQQYYRNQAQINIQPQMTWRVRPPQFHVAHLNTDTYYLGEKEPQTQLQKRGQGDCVSEKRKHQGKNQKPPELY